MVGEARQLLFASHAGPVSLCSTLPWVFPARSQGLHSHHIVSQQFCLCWCPEHSTEACGHSMAALHILQQVGSRGVNI